jgi:hypothetical protein
MNWKVWKNEPNELDEPIAKVLEELRQQDPNSKEFSTNISYLERLTNLKVEVRLKRRISPDTLMIVAGNLLGILIIVAYEQNHAMTSKGLNYIKPVKQ